MISDNVAQMWRSVAAVSSEQRDTGLWLLPRLLVPGQHSS